MADNKANLYLNARSIGLKEDEKYLSIIDLLENSLLALFRWAIFSINNYNSC